MRLIDAVLGKDPISGNSEPIRQDLAYSDIAEAYANLITDVTVTESDQSSVDSSPLSPQRIHSLIKGMHPDRQRPSKDSSKRFAAGELPFSAAPDPAYDVKNHQYWAVHATERVLRNEKVVVLLSQIVYISEADKPVSHSMKANPNTSVVLNVYQYNPQANSYSTAGRSALLNPLHPKFPAERQAVSGRKNRVQLRSTPFLLRSLPRGQA